MGLFAGPDVSNLNDSLIFCTPPSRPSFYHLHLVNYAVPGVTGFATDDLFQFFDVIGGPGNYQVSIVLIIWRDVQGLLLIGTPCYFFYQLAQPLYFFDTHPLPPDFTTAYRLRVDKRDEFLVGQH
jgi:hypothetical protein